MDAATLTGETRDHLLPDDLDRTHDLAVRGAADLEHENHLVDSAHRPTSDLAAHASAGITDRTRVLFGPPGRAYVYLIYGIHECLNFVAEPEGLAGCVLIRALEPLCGVEAMRRRRPAARRRSDLCSGPGKLTAAMGITRALNGADVTSPGDFVVRGLALEPPVEIATSTRIGITKCADWPLRFVVSGSPYVSRQGADAPA